MARKGLVDTLVRDCTENIEEVKLAKRTSAENENDCKSSCILHIVLSSIVLTINIVVGTYFVHYNYMNRYNR